tara:strand:+ start:788 stop:1033 length:246 start_codon:yes stop_codon:yes gene_type:complete
MKKVILKTLLNRVNTNNSIGWKVIDADNVNLDNLVKELLVAINYTRCCESDSEQLCDCKKHSIKTNYGFDVCTKCGNEFDN